MPVIGGYTCVEHGELLPVPGKPIVVGLPGHAKGSTGTAVLADHGVFFTGDALVTLNLLTGRRGPQLRAAAFMEDTRHAMCSLDRIVVNGGPDR